MTAIRTTDLTFSWPSGRGVEGFQVGPLTLDLPAGQRTAVVGPSGSGKSTVLRLIAGLERPSGGELALDGQVVAGSRWVPPERRGIGFVFQDGSLWPHMKAREHLSFANQRIDRGACEQLLEEVGLGDRAGHRPAQLSGGEQRRLGLARALASDPRVLLLDEPLASVDPDRRDGLALLVRRVADQRDLALVLVTHDREEALAMADHIVAFREGRIVESGPAHELVQNPRTAWTAAFLGHASCFPVAPEELAAGVATTPFGRLPLPRNPESPSPQAMSPLSLTVMPGDAAVDPEGPGQGSVLRSEPLGFGAQGIAAGPPGLAEAGGSAHPTWMVLAEVGGRTIRATASSPLQAGQPVRLRLCNTRFLPDDVVISEPGPSSASDI